MGFGFVFFSPINEIWEYSVLKGAKCEVILWSVLVLWQARDFLFNRIDMSQAFTGRARKEDYLTCNFYIRKKWWPPLNYPRAATGSRSKGSIRPYYIRTVVASKPLSNPLLPAGYFDDHEGGSNRAWSSSCRRFLSALGRGRSCLVSRVCNLHMYMMQARKIEVTSNMVIQHNRRKG